MSCADGFELIGERFIECYQGQWIPSVFNSRCQMSNGSHAPTRTE